MVPKYLNASVLSLERFNQAFCFAFARRAMACLRSVEITCLCQKLKPNLKLLFSKHLETLYTIMHSL